MTFEPTAIEAMGDRGILVRFQERPSRELTEFLMGLSLAARDVAGVVDAAPGHTTVLIEVESGARREVEARIPELASATKTNSGKLIRVPIRYDGEDLAWVCKHTKLSKKELARRHSSKAYDVKLIGSPGFIYLSQVAPSLEAPRLDDPRSEVPPGSVGIGGRQTGIYGRKRPGGWRLIGTIPNIPAVRPGDRIKFTVE